MRIAYFSPLNPQRSGISDYSEELLPHLAERADVTLFVDGFVPANTKLTKNFPIVDYRRHPSKLTGLKEFDATLYHMGNDHRYHAGIFDTMQRHPGVVVFHDFALQDFFLGLARDRKSIHIYLDELEACHGTAAREIAEHAIKSGNPPPFVETALDYPLNCRIAQRAKGIIVHSRWSRSRFKEIAPRVPIAHIPMPVKPIAPHETTRNGNEAIRIASFGLIIPGKGIDLTLRALASLRDEYDFHYTLVGAENPYFNVRSLITAYRMDDRVTVTGHISLEQFEAQIVASDIALNLRERTVGETSASLCRIMAAGVPVVVSNVGAFSELPDDAVVKLDHDIYAERMLAAYLRRLMDDAQLRKRIGDNARRYVAEEHDINRSAKLYLEFIRSTLGADLRRQFVDIISEELVQLGIDGDEASLLRSVALDVSSLAIVPRDVNGNGHRVMAPDNTSAFAPPSHGRLSKLAGIDYKRAAIEYPNKLDAERYHYLSTKPFYNLANKPPKHWGEGMDAETFRHFCDFANIAVTLALPAGRKILDVGCGSGWLSEFFARLGYDVTGIDISPELIAIANKRVASLAYGADHETSLRCNFVVHDVESGPLAQTFDAVVCYDSLHHFEDEQAVVSNLAAMTSYGGFVFILEGERPEAGSSTEEELMGVMQQYETLESPFSRAYLHTLLDDAGLAVIGDYLSVNGLFDRETFAGDLQRVQPPGVNYLLCKKVVRNPGPAASTITDSRDRSAVRASITTDELARSVRAGSAVKFSLLIENTGSGLWLVGPAERAGSVMLGLKLLDPAGTVVWERHGTPPLPYAIAPGERVKLKVELTAPLSPNNYTLKIDMVAQHVCWFEDAGSPTFTQELVTT